ncbi:MAG: enoyl-CoA hydratase/isomerase family protein [Bacteroidota bacterium]
MQKFKEIDVQAFESYCVLSLNRSSKRNAINRSMRKELKSFLAWVNFPFIILTGLGKGFCAGLDLKEEPTTEDAQDFMALLNSMYSHESIFLAAVNGAARGGGMMLINACDLAIGSESASFGMPSEVPIPDTEGGTQKLQNQTASWMFLAGKVISATEGMHLGILQEVVPHSQLLNEAHKRVNKLISSDLVKLNSFKKQINIPPFENQFRSKADGLAAFLSSS